jgi:hypothetical protein
VGRDQQLVEVDPLDRLRIGAKERRTQILMVLRVIVPPWAARTGGQVDVDVERAMIALDLVGAGRRSLRRMLAASAGRIRDVPWGIDWCRGF